MAKHSDLYDESGNPREWDPSTELPVPEEGGPVVGPGSTSDPLFNEPIRQFTVDQYGNTLPVTDSQAGLGRPYEDYNLSNPAPGWTPQDGDPNTELPTPDPDGYTMTEGGNVADFGGYSVDMSSRPESFARDALPPDAEDTAMAIPGMGPPPGYNDEDLASDVSSPNGEDSATPLDDVPAQEFGPADAGITPPGESDDPENDYGEYAASQGEQTSFGGGPSDYPPAPNPMSDAPGMYGQPGDDGGAGTSAAADAGITPPGESDDPENDYGEYAASQGEQTSFGGGPSDYPPAPNPMSDAPNQWDGDEAGAATATADDANGEPNDGADRSSFPESFERSAVPRDVEPISIDDLPGMSRSVTQEDVDQTHADQPYVPDISPDEGIDINTLGPFPGAPRTMGPPPGYDDGDLVNDVSSPDAEDRGTQIEDVPAGEFGLDGNTIDPEADADTGAEDRGTQIDDVGAQAGLTASQDVTEAADERQGMSSAQAIQATQQGLSTAQATTVAADEREGMSSDEALQATQDGLSSDEAATVAADEREGMSSDEALQATQDGLSSDEAATVAADEREGMSSDEALQATQDGLSSDEAASQAADADSGDGQDSADGAEAGGGDPGDHSGDPIPGLVEPNDPDFETAPDGEGSGSDGEYPSLDLVDQVDPGGNGATDTVVAGDGPPPADGGGGTPDDPPHPNPPSAGDDGGDSGGDTSNMADENYDESSSNSPYEAYESGGDGGDGGGGDGGGGDGGGGDGGGGDGGGGGGGGGDGGGGDE